MLPKLSTIAAEQVAPTVETMKKTKQFLDYAASHDETVITDKASSMVLVIHSDTSYLNEPQARSRAGGHFFMSNNKGFPSKNFAVFGHCTSN